jgi:Zn-dependent metalloprotease
LTTKSQKDPQPKDMAHFVITFEDNGGVHINSGIPNRAFYEVAIRIGGFAWEKSGRIWYETLRNANLKPNADFITFAKLTYDIAGRLYTANSPEQQAVKDGWAAVGLNF